MCNDSSTKPLATDSRWTSSAPATCSTTKTGSVIVYGWAKDNAAGVSAGKTFTTWVPGTHTHVIADVQGLQTALNGKAAITHNHDSEYQKKYANVVVVAKSGGDFADPIAAMNSITDASATNHYLLKIMPGVFDLGSNRLVLTEGIDVEGSGSGITVLKATGQVAQITWEAELRNIALHSNAAGGMAAVSVYYNSKLKNAVVIVDATEPGIGVFGLDYPAGPGGMIENVKFEVSCAQADNCNGVTATSSMQNVEIVVHGGNSRIVRGLLAGEDNSHTGYTLRNIDVKVDGNTNLYDIVGFYSGALPSTQWSNLHISSNGIGFAGNASIRDSVIKGTLFSVSAESMNIANTLLDGPTSPTASWNCVGVYNANFAPLTCQ